MSDATEHSRRDFMVGAAIALGSGLLLSDQQGAAATMLSAKPQLLLFDPDQADACRDLAGGAGRGCITRPIVGDRVRFARDVLSDASAPEIVSGITSYADFVLLSGCAAEQGYRVLSERAHGPLIVWKIGRLRGATYPG